MSLAKLNEKIDRDNMRHEAVMEWSDSGLELLKKNNETEDSASWKMFKSEAAASTAKHLALQDERDRLLKRLGIFPLRYERRLFLEDIAAFMELREEYAAKWCFGEKFTRSQALTVLGRVYKSRATDAWLSALNSASEMRGSFFSLADSAKGKDTLADKLFALSKEVDTQ